MAQRRTRDAFEAFGEDTASSSSSIGVFTMHSSGMNVSQLAASMQDSVRPMKRRKTNGLNSRFDRMIETVNVMHRSPTESRRRTRSSGSSSASSYDLPKTPLDAYDGLNKGRLGKGFSVIKLKSSPTHGKECLYREKNSSSPLIDNDDLPAKTAPNTRPSEPLPAWLSSTFATLDAHNPLRLLMPRYPSIDNSPPSNQTKKLQRTHSRSLPPNHQPVVSQEPTTEADEAVFAFSLPERLEAQPGLERSPIGPPDYPQAQYVEPMPPPIYAPEQVNFSPPEPLIYESYSPANTKSPPGLPFSTPGPGAGLHILASPYSDTHPSNSMSMSGPLTYPSNRFIEPPSVSLSRQPVAPSSPLYATYDNSILDIDYNSFYEDPVTDDSLSDPLLHGYMRSNPQLQTLSTPAYHIPRPIYFDSPTEDPSDSDPLQPGFEAGYELDTSALDFQWKPFIRNGNIDSAGPKLSSEKTLYLPESHSPSQYPNEPLDKIESPTPSETQNYHAFYPSVHSIQSRTSPQIILLSPPKSLPPSSPPSNDNENKLQHCSSPQSVDRPESPPRTPERTAPPPTFAPASGIFISPLAGEKSSSEPETAAEEEIDTYPKSEYAHNNSPADDGPPPDECNYRPSSQDSNDSIESWADPDVY